MQQPIDTKLAPIDLRFFAGLAPKWMGIVYDKERQCIEFRGAESKPDNVQLVIQGTYHKFEDDIRDGELIHVILRTLTEDGYRFSIQNSFDKLWRMSLETKTSCGFPYNFLGATMGEVVARAFMSLPARKQEQSSRLILLKRVEMLGQKACMYAGDVWTKRRCDCKYEVRGCPELREIHKLILQMSDEQFDTNLKEFGQRMSC